MENILTGKNGDGAGFIRISDGDVSLKSTATMVDGGGRGKNGHGGGKSAIITVFYEKEHI